MKRLKLFHKIFYLRQGALPQKRRAECRGILRTGTCAVYEASEICGMQGAEGRGARVPGVPDAKKGIG